jgi:hypothetical protein
MFKSKNKLNWHKASVSIPCNVGEEKALWYVEMQ